MIDFAANKSVGSFKAQPQNADLSVVWPRGQPV